MWNRRNARTVITLKIPTYESGEEWDPQVDFEETTHNAEMVYQGVTENEVDRETREHRWLMRVGPEVWVPTDAEVTFDDREGNSHTARVRGEQVAQDQVRRGGTTHREIDLSEVLG